MMIPFYQKIYFNLDFESHFNGYGFDTAFSISLDSKYDNLHQTSKEATNARIK